MIHAIDRGTFAVVAARAGGEACAQERAEELARSWDGPVALVLTAEPGIPVHDDDLPPNLRVVTPPDNRPPQEIAAALLAIAEEDAPLERVLVIAGADDLPVLPAFAAAAYPSPIEVDLLPSADVPNPAWLWQNADGIVLADTDRLYQLAAGQPALPVRVVPRATDKAQTPWRQHPAFGAAPRVSVVTPVLGRPDLVRRMAASVLERTPDLLELILVDDASPAGTLAELERIAGKETRVRLLVHGEPRGFAATCNRGLAVARGEQVIVLAGETVVTPEWARRLRQHLERQPRAGAAGPLSNRVPGLQQCAPVDYDERTLCGLMPFAARLAQSASGCARGVVGLDGFCLAVTRPALRRVGGFDPHFCTARYADEDWCLRLLAAGLVPYCADDVFVHFEGGAGVPADNEGGALLEHSWALFRTKWGLPPDRPQERRYSPEELPLAGFTSARHFIAPWLAVEPLPSGGIE